MASIEEDAALELIAPQEGRRGEHETLDSLHFALRLMRVPDVWAMGITGAGVLVSHCDAGVSGTHPALQSSWRGNFGYPWQQCWLDLAGSSTTPVAYNTHGTQTMSLICGMAPGDTVGVAWGARWISGALSLSGAETVASAIAAFQWLANPDGNVNTFDDVPRVCSNSWGIVPGSIPACYDVLNAAIDNLEAAGVAVVFAAGNENPVSGIRIPADRASNMTDGFAVGAWDYATGDVWAQSSRGPVVCSGDPALRIKPEVVAPGVNVRCAGSGSSYGYATGTSYSVAYSAGVLALMAEANPGLDPDSLKEILLYSAVDQGANGNDNNSGYGLIDALAAVQGAIYGVGWVAGTVTDDWGEPVPATFTILGYPQQFVTDAYGYFCFPMPAQIPLTWQIVLPSFNEFEATTVFLPGDTLWADVVLQPSNNGVLSGTVIDCGGLPAVGCTVELVNQPLQPVTTNLAGRFQFGLPAGVYDVTARNGFCADALVPAVQVIPGGIVDIEVVLPFNPSHMCGPPDSFGYIPCDSYDMGGPEYRWIECAPIAGGRGVVHNLQDDGCVQVLLPFPITYYGITRDRLYVHGNGFAHLNGTTMAAYINTNLPTTLGPAMFGLWDDFSDVYGGDICSWFDAGLGRFIVEFSHVPRYDSQDQFATFQIHVLNPEVYPTTTGNSIIEYFYDAVDVPESATVGIDLSGGSNSYSQYGANGVYPAHATPIESGLAVRMTPGAAVAGLAQLSVSNAPLVVDLPSGQAMDTALVLVNSGTLPVSYAVAVPGDSVAGSYVVSDSRAGGPPYSFTDISSIGANLAVVADDSIYFPYVLPWHFKLYDRCFDRVGICTNGFLTFTSAMAEYINQPLSLQKDPYYMLAPYWRDLNFPSGDQGRIYSYSDTANDRVIVQYQNVRWWESTNRQTFQIVLWHDGRIDFAYGTLNGPVNQCTVGLKGRNTAQIAQLAYNSTFLTNNCLLRFTPPTPSGVAFAEVRDLRIGVLPAGGSVSVPIRLTNNTLGFGALDCGVTVRCSEPDREFWSPSVVVQAAPSTIAAALVARAGLSGLTLNWARLNTPYYCIYSGTLDDSVLTTLVATVADTFFAITTLPSARQQFEVRMCDGPPVAGGPRLPGIPDAIVSKGVEVGRK
ncbi:S8 family serine peptidase [candidate division KSB1 bacterium]|nr:S8 family serine peptidase [candidate division KSB1 bacterium]